MKRMTLKLNWLLFKQHMAELNRLKNVCVAFRSREAISAEYIDRLAAFGGDCVNILENLGRSATARIDARAWHRTMTKRFAQLTNPINFYQKPSMKKGKKK